MLFVEKNSILVSSLWRDAGVVEQDTCGLDEKGDFMRYSKFAVACVAACLCVQPAMSSLGATVVAGGGSTVQSGPGGAGGPGAADASVNAWKKVNGQYVDDQGNVIQGAILRGISVSKWQGNIDWAQVAADDIEFAMIRMVSYGYEGEITMDETFDRNMREASAHGIKTAPYIYLQTRTVEEARAAAQFAVDTARNYRVDYPIAVDVESQSIMDLSTQELTDVVNAFCQVIAQSGYTPIIYSDYWKFTNEMDTSQFPYDIWLARYGAGSEYANRTIWQPTDKGRVNGIAGDVCLEFAYKDYAGSGQGQNAPGAQGGTTGPEGTGTQGGTGTQEGPGGSAGPGGSGGPGGADQSAAGGSSPVITVE